MCLNGTSIQKTNEVRRAVVSSLEEIMEHEYFFGIEKEARQRFIIALMNGGNR